jgi:hypothetical protein
MKKLNKEEFVCTLRFLSGFAGYTDIDDPEMKEELWKEYQELMEDGDDICFDSSCPPQEGCNHRWGNIETKRGAFEVIVFYYQRCNLCGLVRKI